ncbi:MAG: S8 family serine peptidase [Acidobacteria bacterium]|nr:S8 family serine peptidase [Acidobacteriota bacterium]
MSAVHAAPPPAIVAPVRGRESARESQVFDQDVQALTGQAWLRAIRWTPAGRIYNAPPLVAVLDTGVSPQAAGLANRVDTAGAKSYAFGGGDPLADAQGHGTLVAGIIATVASGAEANPGVKILPVQIAGPTGQTSAQAVADGIYYAISRRARIINLSLQGSSRSKLEQDAINAAVRAGILVVAASGNSGKDTCGVVGITQCEYPGAYRHVLAVGATDEAGNALPESTRGMHVAVAAPGRDIVAGSARGPEGGQRFETRTGTSMAAAVVTGVAARLLAARPSLTADQLTEIIMSTARGTPGGIDRARGSGVVDLSRALVAKPPWLDTTEPDDDAPGARGLTPLVARGYSYGQRKGRLRTWADLRDYSVVYMRKGQQLSADATVQPGNDVDLYLWRPGTPAYRQGAKFARQWLLAGAVNKGATETLAFRAPEEGEYLLEVRLAGAQRLVRPRYLVTATITQAVAPVTTGSGSGGGSGAASGGTAGTNGSGTGSQG